MDAGAKRQLLRGRAWLQSLTPKRRISDCAQKAECRRYWTDEERSRFHEAMRRCVGVSQRQLQQMDDRACRHGCSPNHSCVHLSGGASFPPRHGADLNAIAREVGTRSITQVRTHIQKYHLRLVRCVRLMLLIYECKLTRACPTRSVSTRPRRRRPRTLRTTHPCQPILFDSLQTRRLCALYSLVVCNIWRVLCARVIRFVQACPCPCAHGGGPGAMLPIPLGRGRACRSRCSQRWRCWSPAR